MSLGNVARVAAVLAACVAAVGSSTSTSNTPSPQTGPMPADGSSSNGPPPAQAMEAARALGLWKSTFGAVRIEADAKNGGLEAGNVQGIWVYQRQGKEVVGYFNGSLRGNVMQFRWQEDNSPPLTGEGYLVFDTQGRQYTGRWWSEHRDRVGEWNGWRQTESAPNRPCAAGDPQCEQPREQPRAYQPPPYQQPGQQPYQPQPYQPQPQPYQPQPYQPQPYQPQQPPYQQPPYQPQPTPYQPQPGTYQPQPGPYQPPPSR